MPTIPCADKTACACEDSPFTNLSSEAPDVPTFTGISFTKQMPPLGVAWNTVTCYSTCEAASQQQADLCAALVGFECVVGTWTEPPAAPPSAPPVPPPRNFSPGGPGVPVFTNAEQMGTAKCPDGELFSFRVPAGQYFGLNQATADAAALSAANQQAELHKICLSDILLLTCVNQPYAANIVATGAFLAVPPQTDNWQLQSGMLPPGLNLSTGNFSGGVTTLAGTPTTVGQYLFVVSVTDPAGDHMAKSYFLTVAGITNAGLPDGKQNTPYVAQLAVVGFTAPATTLYTLTGGTLPTGLTLNADGSITGTPTGSGTSTFQVTVDDLQTGFTCAQTVSIKIAKLALDWSLLSWPAPHRQTVGAGGLPTANAAGATFNLATASDQNAGTTGQFASVADKNGTFGGPSVVASLPPYTGPMVNANLHLTIAASAVGFATNSTQFSVRQDGVSLLFTITQAGGDFPFVVQAGVASLIEIWEAGCFSQTGGQGGDTSSLTITGTFS